MFVQKLHMNSCVLLGCRQKPCTIQAASCNSEICSVPSRTFGGRPRFDKPRPGPVPSSGTVAPVWSRIQHRGKIEDVSYVIHMEFGGPVGQPAYVLVRQLMHLQAPQRIPEGMGVRPGVGEAGPVCQPPVTEPPCLWVHGKGTCSIRFGMEPVCRRSHNN